MCSFKLGVIRRGCSKEVEHFISYKIRGCKNGVLSLICIVNLLGICLSPDVDSIEHIIKKTGF